MSNSYTLSQEHFENIFKNVLSPINNFKKTEETFNNFIKELNISFDMKLSYKDKEYSYLELYNFAYYNRFNIFY